jgi:ABC-type polar amino acid transport system ATPase subunit
MAPMAAEGRPIIEFREVSKRFGQNEVLRGITNRVAEGAKVVVIGPSGSGKSTLLRTVNRLETIDSGEVVVDGVSVHDRRTDINALRAHVGMVQQSFNLFPQLSVLDNVTLAPRKVKKEQHATAVRRAQALLERVGIPEKANAYPVQLSGGQQQRVAIARALAMEPSVMRDLAREGMTMLVVSHEMGFAREVADRVWFMADGAIEEEGTPAELFERPKGERTRRFLSRIIAH